MSNGWRHDPSLDETTVPPLFPASNIYWSPITLIHWHSTVLSLTCHLANEVVSGISQIVHRDICHSSAFPGASLVIVWSTCHLEKIFSRPVSFGRKCKLNVIPLKWSSCSHPSHYILLFNPPHPAFTFVCFFARLMSRGKTCPMESLSTCEASEKETGLGRKHCKGKIVCNNTASSNLNLVLSHCFTHLPFNFYLQPVFNILSLTLYVHPFILYYLFIW